MDSSAAEQGTSRGRLFVVSAPSGAGKTSITAQLRQQGLVKVSISHTTRQPRGAEKNGEAYFFVSEEAFLAMRAAGRFLEWAEVYGHYYGTSADWVEQQVAAGATVLLEIDCQGALQVQRLRPQAVLIFIAPPDMQTLRRRLEGRRQDDAATVERRLAAAEQELRLQKRFDYVIINDALEDAVRQVAEVIRRRG